MYSGPGLVDTVKAVNEYSQHKQEEEAKSKLQNGKGCENRTGTGLLSWMMSSSRCVVPKKTEPTENAASAQTPSPKPK